MKLITLSGVDGSGKSTQLTLLKEKLEQDNKKVFYFHTVEFSLANRLARLFKNEKGFVPGKEKASVQSSWISLQLRKLFLLLDIFRFKVLMRKLAQEKYDCILSDRYFYDSVINILYLYLPPLPSGEGWGEGSENSLIRPTGTFSQEEKRALLSLDTLWLERFIPKPDTAFYFQITAEEIMKRDRVPEQGIGYLKDKIAIFEQKKRVFGLISIDASQEKTALYHSIINHCFQ